MTLSMMIGYFVIVQLNTTVGTWTYGLPLLIVAMVYLDKKIVMVTNGIALVSIVVHLVRCFLGDGSDLQNNVIGLFVLLLTAYAAIVQSVCSSVSLKKILQKFKMHRISRRIVIKDDHRCREYFQAFWRGNGYA